MKIVDVAKLGQHDKIAEVDRLPRFQSTRLNELLQEQVFVT